MTALHAGQAQIVVPLATAVREALRLLERGAPARVRSDGPSEFEASLFDECIALCARRRAAQREPIRTVHHLSGTGGTLITKCLAAMPNVIALNEIDPLSTVQTATRKAGFTPTDITALLYQSGAMISKSLLSRLFQQNLGLLNAEATRTGRRVLLRDHSHSLFLMKRVAARPTLRELVTEKFEVLSIVTVRDPLDSFLSIRKSGWLSFRPATFDEYCRRYAAFLDRHRGVPVFRYEDFTAAPADEIQRMCAALQLPYNAEFLEIFDAFRFSGDSGRGGTAIEPKPRRAVPADLQAAAAQSTAYMELAQRLSYAAADRI